MVPPVVINDDTTPKRLYSLLKFLFMGNVPLNEAGFAVVSIP
jgi:hypothetical protein